jgi:beta-lactamase regulating signal transducer with metallopeptidase domain
MMLYTHVLWLAALHAMGCGPDGDEMHRLLLGLAPFTCGFALMLRVTRPFADIHSILRWLGVPLLLLLPFVIRSIWSVLQLVNIDASAICASASPTTWESLWAPIQLTTVLLISYMVVKVWRNVKRDASDDVSAQI